MASPHAAGVAALVVSAHGEWMGKFKGWGMEPRNVAKVLFATATQTPCPADNPFIYPGLPANYTALCVGDAAVQRLLRARDRQRARSSERRRR